MSDTQNQKTVRRSVTVPVDVERAFAVFTDDISRWWPREFTFGEARYVRAAFDTHVGGQWYEVDSAGTRTSWGDILTWEPPRRLVVTWQVSPRRTPEPDAAHASQVEVRFTPEGDAQTRVEVEHSAFERHGDGADVMRDGMASPEGWSKLLERFAAAVG